MRSRLSLASVLNPHTSIRPTHLTPVMTLALHLYARAGNIQYSPARSNALNVRTHSNTFVLAATDVLLLEPSKISKDPGRSLTSHAQRETNVRGVQLGEVGEVRGQRHREERCHRVHAHGHPPRRSFQCQQMVDWEMGTSAPVEVEERVRGPRPAVNTFIHLLAEPLLHAISPYGHCSTR